MSILVGHCPIARCGVEQNDAQRIEERRPKCVEASIRQHENRADQIDGENNDSLQVDDYNTPGQCRDQKEQATKEEDLNGCDGQVRLEIEPDVEWTHAIFVSPGHKRS